MALVMEQLWRWALVLMPTVVVLVMVHLGVSFLQRYVLAPLRVQRVLERQGVKGPPGQWMVGNCAEVKRMLKEAEAKDMDVGDYNILPRILPHHVAWTKQYGKRYMWFQGPETLLTVTEPAILKELLFNKDGILTRDIELGKKVAPLLGKGLTFTDGEEWALHRRIVSPAFHCNRINDMVTAMVESTYEMFESLDKVVVTGGGGSVEVEMQKCMVDVTADIISRTAFGGSYERGKKVFEQLSHLMKLMAANNHFLSIPILRSFPTQGHLKISRHRKELEQTIKEIIQVRKDQIKKGQSESYGNDLLGLMILAVDEDASLAGGNAHFDLQSMIDECKTFYLAGHETTSTLLTWTMMLLGKHTEWQDRARAEVFEVCGDKPPNAGTIGKLKVLTMIVNESLRLFPPVTRMQKSIVHDVTIDGLHLPKDTVVFLPGIALHHDPDLWGDDYMKFKPERFANGVANAAKHQLAFMPFSFGPRMCVGINFAIQEAKVVLAMLLQRFHFRLSPHYRHTPKVAYVTLTPQYGMPLILEKVHN